MRSILLVVVVVVIAWFHGYYVGDRGTSVVVREEPRFVVDSTCFVRLDSLQRLYDEKIILFRLTEQQVKRYASIVRNDPSQARFLVGWVHRAFDKVTE